MHIKAHIGTNKDNFVDAFFCEVVSVTLCARFPNSFVDMVSPYTSSTYQFSTDNGSVTKMPKFLVSFFKIDSLYEPHVDP